MFKRTISFPGFPKSLNSFLGQTESEGGCLFGEETVEKIKEGLAGIHRGPGFVMLPSPWCQAGIDTSLQSCSRPLSHG